MSLNHISWRQNVAVTEIEFFLIHLDSKPKFNHLQVSSSPSLIFDLAINWIDLAGLDAISVLERQECDIRDTFGYKKQTREFADTCPTPFVLNTPNTCCTSWSVTQVSCNLFLMKAPMYLIRLTTSVCFCRMSQWDSNLPTVAQYSLVWSRFSINIRSKGTILYQSFTEPHVCGVILLFESISHSGRWSSDTLLTHVSLQTGQWHSAHS